MNGRREPAGPDGAGPGRTGPDGAGPGRTGPDGAGPGRGSGPRAGWARRAGERAAEWWLRRRVAKPFRRYADEAREHAFLKLGPSRRRPLPELLAGCGALLLLTAVHLGQRVNDDSAERYQRVAAGVTTFEVTVDRDGWYGLWVEVPADRPYTPPARTGPVARTEPVTPGAAGLFGAPVEDPPYPVRRAGRPYTGHQLTLGSFGPGRYRITLLGAAGAPERHGTLAFGAQPATDDLASGPGPLGLVEWVTARSGLALFPVAAAVAGVRAWRTRAGRRTYAGAVGPYGVEGGRG
ncbi:hypothetical protein NX801_13505 [Streptomyces sp. LP05-1]|uniref:Uncharacterized protein n=1 Tax=Streptomyces pyxinae TaxID=2970734 RepID=A0ABT2CGW2_9ACTN|nr:hypothetical protein [Streptomyces sp. LP05-1]MCS0636657.1 hypothetical protein [Streptomyces sp. LP05-1]